jgi:hypothetical protein
MSSQVPWNWTACPSSRTTMRIATSEQLGQRRTTPAPK